VPGTWQRVTIKKRQIQFAWGPTQDRSLRQVAQLELVMNAGRGGGHGSVFFSGLELHELAPEPTTHPSPVASASSAAAGHGAALAADGDEKSVWRSDPHAGPTQSLMLDLRERRELGGLTISWEDAAFGRIYDVEASGDGHSWRAVRRVRAGHGGTDFLCLAEDQARFLRLVLLAGPARSYGVREIRVQDVGFCDPPAKLFQSIAAHAPPSIRGRFPRGLSGEQSYWTVVGVDGGVDKALLSEDGLLEPAQAQFSIEPFIRTASGVLTWADVEIEHSLEDGYLPIPQVRWRKAGLSLAITAFARSSAASPLTIATYELANDSGRAQDVSLVLAVRPFQVDPPTQFLNSPGGTSPIRTLAWKEGRLTVNGERTVIPLQPPQEVAATPYDAGQIPELLAAGGLQPANAVSDEFGYASGALVYAVHLAAGEHATFGLLAPVTAKQPPEADEVLASVSTGPGGNAPQWLAREHQAAVSEWRGRLNRVSLRLPESAGPIANTIRAGRYPDRARGSCAAPRRALLPPRLDPGRGDDVERALAAGRNGRRQGFPLVVCTQAICQWQGALLCRLPRRGPHRRERQPRRADLSGRAGVPLHR
jgi:hypothetical protein